METFSEAQAGSLAAVVQIDSPLFLWRGAGIILVGQYASGRWTLARGWAAPGAITDVRRWSFDSVLLFRAQVRRLTREATGRHDIATTAFLAAGAWAADHACEQRD